MLNVLYDNNIVLSLKRYPILNSAQLRNFVQQYYMISCLQKFPMCKGMGYFSGKRKRTVSCAWREQFKRGPVPSARTVSLSAVKNALIYLTTTSRKRSKLMGQ